jgi:hypothetical protein
MRISFCLFFLAVLLADMEIFTKKNIILLVPALSWIAGKSERSLRLGIYRLTEAVE